MRLYGLSKGGALVPSKKGVCVCSHAKLKQKGGESLLLSPALGTTSGGGFGMGTITKGQIPNAPIQNTEALQGKLSRLSSMQLKKPKKNAFVRL